MKHYNPRQYWPNRLKREGALYVSTRNSKLINDKQWKVFREALLHICPADVGRVLDFGCGVGRFAETMLSVAASYVGADINEEVSAFFPDLENATFVPLPEDKLPFEDGEFDSAIAVTVLQHIVDLEQYRMWSSELSRVVRPGGAFLIIDDADQKTKMSAHMKVRGPLAISASLGATLDYDAGVLSAERPRSHYCFRAIKNAT